MPRVLRPYPRRRPLLAIDETDAPEALVLLVPGGPERGFGTTRPWDLAYLRMLPFGRAVTDLAGPRVAVVRLRHRQTGWNGPQETVLAEARWALADLTRRFPTALIGVVGHSLGGRTAVRLAGDERVAATVALAPWLPAGEPAGHVAGRELLVVHGEADRICPVRDTDSWVDRAREAGGHVRYVRVPRTGHLLLRAPGRAHRAVARYLVSRLLSTEVEPMDGTAAS